MAACTKGHLLSKCSFPISGMTITEMCQTVWDHFVSAREAHTAMSLQMQRQKVNYMKPANLKVNVQFCVESVFNETMGAGACQRAGIRSRTSSISCVLWPFGRGATTFQTSGMVGGTKCLTKKVPHKKSRLDQSKFVFGKMGSQLKP